MPRDPAIIADERHMGRALRLAERARGRTSPNPLVGSVIVNNGQVVGEGYHRVAGAEHAEAAALRAAGDMARGADLYVNLEPCNHRGRTGPCAQAIIEAGVARVVVGMEDPNPLVNGQGIQALRDAGITVEIGLLEAESRQLNEAFLHMVGTGLPLVTLKSAITLDGRVACRGGDAKWVTGPDALKEGHRMRDLSDVIMVGVGTVLADDATLTCRGILGGQDPMRVVVDSTLRTPPDAKVVAAAADSTAPTLVVGVEGAPGERAAALEAAGAEVLLLPAGEDARVPLELMLRALAEREVMTVMLEGGPRLSGGMWRGRLIHRVTAFLAPKILGDPEALPMIAAGEVSLMAQATELQDVQVQKVGADVMIAGRVPAPEEAEG